MEENITKNDVLSITRDSGFQVSIDHIVEIFDKGNFSVSKIKENIQNFEEMTRALIHLSALATENKELAAKIGIANNLIKQENVDKAIKKLTNGEAQEFLNSMHSVAKISLQADLELLGDFSKPETKQALDILERAIEDDLIKEANKDGFDNIEDWRNFNLEKTSVKQKHLQSQILL